MPSRLTVGRVFVPGGRPTVTYVPRDSLRLEGRLAQYLRDRFKMLSVSGPTKTGKTVLLRSGVEGAFWLSGGSIASIDDFWRALADALGSESEIEFTTSSSLNTGGGVNAELNFGLGKVGANSAVEGTGTTGNTRRWQIGPQDAARSFLIEHPDSIVIVDDFHYIPPGVQLKIARGVKDLVFDGLAFIVAAVPHRAYDVVRVEKEMTGRVDQLEVGFWSADDLHQIATKGFEALGVSASPEIIERLVREAFESPHLMQEFCRQLCYDNGIAEAVESPTTLSEPDWDSFFSRLAPNASKTTFDLLRTGPRQRSDRKQRKMADGTSGDIYDVVLRGIAKTGPLTKMSYEQLRAAIREIVAEDPPQRHEVTRVLDQMTDIAKKQPGEPVVEWDTEYSALYIADPYFAYWLRWGSSGSQPTDTVDEDL